MTPIPKESLLAHCAAALLRQQPADQQPAAIRSLLQALAYNSLDPVEVNRHRAALLQAAAEFPRLFQLRAPDAPGLTVFGAEVDPSGIHPGGIGQPRLPASGVGLSFRSAFEGCVGEAVELMSQFETASDALVKAALSECETNRRLLMSDVVSVSLQEAGLPGDTALDWINAHHALDGTLAAIPADLCLRRGSAHIVPPPWPLSIGCSAGSSSHAAMLHALLELIERDAAALWWRGGMRGRLISLDSETTRRALDLSTSVRGTRQRRRSWLLNITTDLAVPAVAAMSVNQDGHGFACGLAARLSLAQAAEAAILEMCQMELAHEVVAAKRHESGDAALNRHDRAHLRRAAELSISDCVLLHPLPPLSNQPFEIETPDAATALRLLLEHLATRGIETFVIDLTRPGFGIPVARVLCPMLEKEPSRVIGDRLRAAIQRTGGGHQHTNGIPLM